MEEGKEKEKELQYPRGVPFLIMYEFLERFNFHGMRTILVIYLAKKLMYSEDDSTTIFHAFTMFVFLTCILGAIISDSWLGKYRTIWNLSLVYIVGSVLLTLGAIPQLSLQPKFSTLIALLLIAFGCGTIKPCIPAIGGDQFKLPEQIKHMKRYFSMFYFAINVGSLLAKISLPFLRDDIHCFEEDSCFSLAFGLTTIFLILAIGISKHCKEGKSNPKPHWLDHAADKYDPQLLEDIKVLLRVLVLYIPLPLFWALLEQQGSRWIFQATRMNGKVGSFRIKPEHMQLVNPFLILFFIPIFEFAFYPLLAKLGIRTPLRKLTMGGVLAGIAFIIAAIVELNIQKALKNQPNTDRSLFRLYNGIPNCNYIANTDIPNLSKFSLNAMNSFVRKNINLKKNTTFNINLIPNKGSNVECQSKRDQIHLIQNDATNYYLYEDQNVPHMLQFFTPTDEDLNDNPKMRRILSNFPDRMQVFKYENMKNDSSEIIFNGLHSGIMKNEAIKALKNRKESSEHAENSISILWLIPQYSVMTLAEAMVSVTGLQFSYTEAPSSMKSVLLACWLLTTALGNLIMSVVSSAKLVRSQFYEFLLFAVLMFLDMVLFEFLAYRYKSNKSSTYQVETKNENDKK